MQVSGSNRLTPTRKDEEMSDEENDKLVASIANRLLEIADKPIDDLRSIAGYGVESRQEAIRHHKGKTRAQLLSYIISEEFSTFEQPVADR